MPLSDIQIAARAKNAPHRRSRRRTAGDSAKTISSYTAATKPNCPRPPPPKKAASKATSCWSPPSRRRPPGRAKPRPRSGFATRSIASEKTPSSPCASRRWGRFSASKAGPRAAGARKVVPMEDINLHFTGDFSAIGLSHNLLSAMIDNHIHHGNDLDLDSRRLSWKRVVDMNDRALRQIVVGLGGPGQRFHPRRRLRYRRRLRDYGDFVPRRFARRS